MQLGFTRGFVQSQAFVRHFGLKAPIRPKGNDLVFDTTQEAGVNAAGERFTFQDEYEWLGFTAREKIFELLNEVAEQELELDDLGYDLNEPDLIDILVKLAKQGRARRPWTTPRFTTVPPHPNPRTSSKSCSTRRREKRPC